MAARVPAWTPPTKARGPPWAERAWRQRAGAAPADVPPGRAACVLRACARGRRGVGCARARSEREAPAVPVVAGRAGEHAAARGQRQPLRVARREGHHGLRSQRAAHLSARRARGVSAPGGGRWRRAGACAQPQAPWRRGSLGMSAPAAAAAARAAARSVCASAALPCCEETGHLIVQMRKGALSRQQFR